MLRLPTMLRSTVCAEPVAVPPLKYMPRMVCAVEVLPPPILRPVTVLSFTVSLGTLVPLLE